MMESTSSNHQRLSKFTMNPTSLYLGFNSANTQVITEESSNSKGKQIK